MHSLQLAGDSEAKVASIMPVATGMGLFMCLAALRKLRPNANHVVWCRCDQNSAVKAIALAGMRLEVVEMKLVGEALETDMEAIAARVQSLGKENVLCVFRFFFFFFSPFHFRSSLLFSSTTSCFAPRVPDKVDEIARFCKEHDVPHLINNAYGVSV